MPDREMATGRTVPAVEPGPLGEVAWVALKLGFTAFGGPAAHIAMLREEVVVRRRWLSEQYFLDLIGATNLIPGPNSTEMVIHCGYLRAGWRGLIAAGTLFITPAALMVLGLAWAYVRWGSTPEAGWLLYGIKPVIIAIVGQALWGLARAAVRSVFLATVGLAALVLYFLGINEIAILFGGALAVLLVHLARQWRGSSAAMLLPLGGLPLPALSLAAPAVPVSLLQLFLTFLKIGAVLYGSGYVLLAFLRRDFVERLGWLTDQQLLDAVAVGQFTPGPVFTTATFVGYLVAGWPGAVLATIGIFLPSFLFVAAIEPFVPRLRRSPWTAPLLDGVNVAAMALMAAVSWQLGREAIVDPLTAGLALIALVLLLRFKVNSAWLVLAGGAIGVVVRLLGG
ncbi:chromate efflux transporter [Thermomicrobiaceae bacterium CFH 74404]|uniref:Chromate efflux transporter n=1 Tax=Thermalbibacter longus TaxID=2951981 RepID=A0AA41WJD5_9BACT|nr:chromate efflux transporter [Thermalbibacter longus]MCM8750471.1 chromate efflux transporter [Thermalbibacter longus]